MLRTKLIKEMDQMRTQAFSPPAAFMGVLEEAEGQGQAWWVYMAFSDTTGEARWLVVFPDTGESRFFTDGELLSGRWDSEHELFFSEDGPSLNLLGEPVSVASIEEEEEEEEEGWRGNL